jgi:hypothetical protein
MALNTCAIVAYEKVIPESAEAVAVKIQYSFTGPDRGVTLQLQLNGRVIAALAERMDGPATGTRELSLQLRPDAIASGSGPYTVVAYTRPDSLDHRKFRDKFASDTARGIAAAGTRAAESDSSSSDSSDEEQEQSPTKPLPATPAARITAGTPGTFELHSCAACGKSQTASFFTQAQIRNKVPLDAASACPSLLRRVLFYFRFPDCCPLLGGG